MGYRTIELERHARVADALITKTMPLATGLELLSRLASAMKPSASTSPSKTVTSPSPLIDHPMHPLNSKHFSTHGAQSPLLMTGMHAPRLDLPESLSRSGVSFSAHTVSLGDRANHWTRCDKSVARWHLPPRTPGHPLPKGEGSGEGEQSSRCLHGAKMSKPAHVGPLSRSEEHTSELQSLR